MGTRIPSCHPDRKLYSFDLCRQCYEKQLIDKNPEFAERQRINKEKWRKNNREYTRKYNKNRIRKELEKRTNTLKKYGITPDDFDRMVAEQNNKCAICNNDFVATPCVDHNHETMKVRGLLCKLCNWLVGHSKEKPLTLLNAAMYLLERN